MESTVENSTPVFDQNFQSNETAPSDLMVNSTNTINYEELHSSTQETSKRVQDVEEMNSRPEIEKTVELNDFPKVQKEHLLEMASAVADVLTNDSEQIDTNLDGDLICRNQFLTSYLEEQKKIMNQLHIELSGSVSIYVLYQL